MCPSLCTLVSGGVSDTAVWALWDFRNQNSAHGLQNAANGLFIGVTAQSLLPPRASISLPEQGGSQELSAHPHISPFCFLFYPLLILQSFPVLSHFLYFTSVSTWCLLFWSIVLSQLPDSKHAKLSKTLCNVLKARQVQRVLKSRK